MKRSDYLELEGRKTLEAKWRKSKTCRALQLLSRGVSQRFADALDMIESDKIVLFPNEKKAIRLEPLGPTKKEIYPQMTSLKGITCTFIGPIWFEDIENTTAPGEDGSIKPGH